MSAPDVLVSDRPADGVLRLLLNRPKGRNALDGALDARLLVERRSESATAYDFTHALVRHTLYEALSTESVWSRGIGRKAKVS